jgi:hypothetical protein
MNARKLSPLMTLADQMYASLLVGLVFIAPQAFSATIQRGPYLQVGTSSNIVVRWRTNTETDTRANFGTNAADLNFSVSSPDLVTEHEITLTNLSPDTKYFYDIGTTTEILAGDASYHFTTARHAQTHAHLGHW